MTKHPVGPRCRRCGRGLPIPAATGRPRAYCKQSCRQRDYEARQRSQELGLGEHELVMTREELNVLHDQLYVLEAAIEDVQRDLKGSPTKQDYVEAIDWLLDAGKPLVRRV